MDEAFEIEARALAQVLEELDYFQILKVGQAANPNEIKAAYYRESRAYHPDRFFQMSNLELKEATVYPTMLAYNQNVAKSNVQGVESTQYGDQRFTSAYLG